MSGPASARPARESERALAASILTDAFVDEAGLNYWLRQGAAKERARARFFEAAAVDIVHPERELWIGEAQGRPCGAAIWLPPGCKAYDFPWWRLVAMTPLLHAISGLGGALRGLALGERLAALHPPHPFAHLVFLGVAGAAQGAGVGSAILKATLAPLDASGTPAFLETTTERNVQFYGRHGFEVSGELSLPEFRLWTMVRTPRSPA